MDGSTRVRRTKQRQEDAKENQEFSVPSDVEDSTLVMLMNDDKVSTSGFRENVKKEDFPKDQFMNLLTLSQDFSVTSPPKKTFQEERKEPASKVKVNSDLVLHDPLSVSEEKDMVNEDLFLEKDYGAALVTAAFALSQQIESLYLPDHSLENHTTPITDLLYDLRSIHKYKSTNESALGVEEIVIQAEPETRLEEEEDSELIQAVDSEDNDEEEEPEKKDSLKELSKSLEFLTTDPDQLEHFMKHQVLPPNAELISTQFTQEEPKEEQEKETPPAASPELLLFNTTETEETKEAKEENTTSDQPFDIGVLHEPVEQSTTIQFLTPGENDTEPHPTQDIEPFQQDVEEDVQTQTKEEEKEEEEEDTKSVTSSRSVLSQVSTNSRQSARLSQAVSKERIEGSKNSLKLLRKLKHKSEETETESEPERTKEPMYLPIPSQSTFFSQTNLNTNANESTVLGFKNSVDMVQEKLHDFHVTRQTQQKEEQETVLSSSDSDTEEEKEEEEEEESQKEVEEEEKKEKEEKEETEKEEEEEEEEEESQNESNKHTLKSTLKIKVPFRSTSVQSAESESESESESEPESGSEPEPECTPKPKVQAIQKGKTHTPPLKPVLRSVHSPNKEEEEEEEETQTLGFAEQTPSSSPVVLHVPVVKSKPFTTPEDVKKATIETSLKQQNQMFEEEEEKYNQYLQSIIPLFSESKNKKGSSPFSPSASSVRLKLGSTFSVESASPSSFSSSEEEKQQPLKTRRSKPKLPKKYAHSSTSLTSEEEEEKEEEEKKKRMKKKGEDIVLQAYSKLKQLKKMTIEEPEDVDLLGKNVMVELIKEKMQKGCLFEKNEDLLQFITQENYLESKSIGELTVLLTNMKKQPNSQTMFTRINFSSDPNTTQKTGVLHAIEADQQETVLKENTKCKKMLRDIIAHKLKKGYHSDKFKELQPDMTLTELIVFNATLESPVVEDEKKKREKEFEEAAKLQIYTRIVKFCQEYDVLVPEHINVSSTREQLMTCYVELQQVHKPKNDYIREKAENIKKISSFVELGMKKIPLLKHLDVQEATHKALAQLNPHFEMEYELFRRSALQQQEPTPVKPLDVVLGIGQKMVFQIGDAIKKMNAESEEQNKDTERKEIELKAKQYEEQLKKEQEEVAKMKKHMEELQKYSEGLYRMMQQQQQQSAPASEEEEEDEDSSHIYTIVEERDNHEEKDTPSQVKPQPVFPTQESKIFTPIVQRIEYTEAEKKSMGIL